MFISSAPGSLYYRWEFKYVNLKLEIKTTGAFEPSFTLGRAMRSLSVSVLGTGGVDSTTEQEQQTERMFKSTFRDFQGKTIEPAIFNSNTIDFNYSLGEFFNRLTNPIFFYRVHANGGKLEKPNFDYEQSNEFLQSAGNAWDIYVAEEEVTETTEQTCETLITADMTNADYGVVDYIGSPDANI
ncbi:1511_t:CDS:2 [Funneliformis geosporum]|uniref:1511_t:CDS:1 n=1 Tax=Funneliformis geosporum TaxID=1117311 RepID=A0A9W4WUX2_9GLOM|nr:1511_t:CDS:2 [Funneliformis geosporum]